MEGLSRDDKNKASGRKINKQKIKLCDFLDCFYSYLVHSWTNSVIAQVTSRKRIIIDPALKQIISRLSTFIKELSLSSRQHYKTNISAIATTVVSLTDNEHGALYIQSAEVCHLLDIFLTNHFLGIGCTVVV